MFKPRFQDPSLYPIKIDDDVRAAFYAYVDEDAYAAVSEASHNMWCSRKGGRWGAGLANSDEDPCKVERTGLLGEMAFGIMFGRPVNLDFKPHGFDYDFEVDGYRIDVKTSTKRPNDDIALIRCESDGGKEISLISDLYVFAYIDDEDRDSGWARVCVVGGLTKEKILEYPKVPARKGNHRNYEIPYGDLESIVELWEVSQREKFVRA